MSLPRLGRWFLVPIASMTACAGTVKVAEVIGGGVARFVSPEGGRAIDSVISVEYRAGVVFGLAAAAFVLAGTRTAPRFRVIIGVLLYLAGAWLAWWELKDWSIPEGYPFAYRPSKVPLAVTLSAGLAAVLLIVADQHRRVRHHASRLALLFAVTVLAPMPAAGQAAEVRAHTEADEVIRPSSFSPAALEPTVLRSKNPAPQLRPRAGTNVPLRLACIAVFVAGLIWVAKMAFD